MDGYAPFCKHVFVPNFVGAKLGALEITDANRHLLRSGYTKRRPEELAVLTRWVARGVQMGGVVILWAGAGTARCRGRGLECRRLEGVVPAAGRGGGGAPVDRRGAPRCDCRVQDAELGKKGRVGERVGGGIRPRARICVSVFAVRTMCTAR